MEKRTFFSDESERYVVFSGAGSERTVTVMLRTGRYQAQKVMIVFQGEFHEMLWDSAENDFDFYRITLPAAEEELVYHFQICTQEGICFYDRAGAFETDRELYPFRLYPDFHVPAWLKGAVMYQIFPDRFRNGDPANDVVSGEYYYLKGPVRAVPADSYETEEFDVGNFCGGDIRGIMEKLDDLADLGVEVLYLNPVFVSPSNHKYDIQDYHHIDPHLGVIVHDEGRLLLPGQKNNRRASRYADRTANEENLTASDRLFAEFIRKCHAKGIRVILDGVFNHCSHLNRWMNREGVYPERGAYRNPESPFHDYFSFKNESCTRYECWWDHLSLPKLNYEGSERLCKEILSIAEKWVSPPFNADGWRLDVAADLGHSEEFNHGFWKQFRQRVKAANPEAVIIAEHYEDAGPWLRGDEWDTVMNYTAFMEPVSWFFTGMEKHSDYAREELRGNGEAFCSMIRTAGAALPYPAFTSAMNQLDNHDHSRFLTRTNGLAARFSEKGKDAASENVRKEVLRQAVTFLFTWPGAPCIYYGDEAGLCGFTDPDSRRPYPWGREDTDLREFFAKTAALRKKHNVLKNGSVHFILAEDQLAGFVRFDEKEQIFAVFSTADEERSVGIPVWAGGRAGYLEEEEFDVLCITGRDGWSFEKRTVKARYGVVTCLLPPDGAIMLLGK